MKTWMKKYRNFYPFFFTPDEESRILWSDILTLIGVTTFFLILSFLCNDDKDLVFAMAMLKSKFNENWMRKNESSFLLTDHHYLGR